MWGFKSKKDREDEFIGFLQLDAVRREISEISVDVFNSKFTPIVNDVQGQLLKAAKDQLINIQAQIQASSAAETARFTAYADEALKAAKDQLINFQVQLQASSAAEIARFTAYTDERLKASRDQFINFLHSEDGRRLMLDLLIEASARGALAPILGAAETRLKNLAAEEIETFRARAEISLKTSADGHAIAVEQQKAKFDNHASKITRDIETFRAQVEISVKASADAHAVAVGQEEAKFDSHANEITRDMTNHVIKDVETHLSASQTEMIERITDRANQRIHWLLEELPTALRDAVDRYVWSGPRFSTRYSNRDLAAAYGISIREVKRWRRNGRLPR